ncbi:MAG: Multidrug resistance transporter, superfamily protein, partial [Frankiales bacterium]|nr:Multidrug resistance transporter, superfamily protein [Frankiales bacterium]
PEQTGVASGMNANIRTIGGSVGAALMGTVVAAGAVAGGLPKESGYTHGFLMLTGLSALATLAALIIPVVRRSHLPGEEPEPAHAALGLVAAGTLVGDKPE